MVESTVSRSRVELTAWLTSPRGRRTIDLILLPLQRLGKVAPRVRNNVGSGVRPAWQSVDNAKAESFMKTLKVEARSIRRVPRSCYRARGAPRRGGEL